MRSTFDTIDASATFRPNYYPVRPISLEYEGLLSSTTANYNTKIIGGNDAIEQLAELRAQSEGDIGVGGATLATQLLKANLLDELLLFTHPVILGSGRPLFDNYDEPLELDLLEHQTFYEGVTMHRYAVRGAK